MRKEEPYIKLPIRYLHELDIRAAVLRAYLDGFVDTGKPVLQTQEQIAGTLNMSHRTIKSKMQILRKGAKIAQQKGKNCPTKGQELPIKGAKIALSEGQKLPDTIYKNNIEKLNESVNEKPTPEIQEIIIAEIVAFYTERGQKYIPDFRQETTAAIELAAKIALLAKSSDPEAVKTYWADFIRRGFAAADDWQREHWDIKTINSQFNAINLKINGKGICKRTAAERRELKKPEGGFTADF